MRPVDNSLQISGYKVTVIPLPALTGTLRLHKAEMLHCINRLEMDWVEVSVAWVHCL